MSLKITKAGMLDTVQDLGRWGYQHLGINPGGAMDRFAASLANALLGKALNSPVFELHFPASEISFQTPCVICLTGADFTPAVNNVPVSLNQPLFIAAGAVLSFAKRKNGARCYFSLLNELALEKWLNGYGTNLKAGAGGYNGRKLVKGDALEYDALPVKNGAVSLLPWRYTEETDKGNEIEFILGNEWNWLTTKSQTDFLNDAFAIAPASDRMGYRLQGNALEQNRHEPLISSAVSFGTIQLLPNGQLILLMADHQTTGGYPRIGHVISAHLPKLAQRSAGDHLSFTMTTVEASEEKCIKQQRLLAQLQNTCHSKMQNWLYAH